MTPADWRRAAGRLIAAAALAAVGVSTALAQDVPEIPPVISPLRVETDHNGVNLLTGRIRMPMPVLSVPGAPNLRFDLVQNAAPYVSGRIAGAAGEIPQASYSVHTGAAASESFRCPDYDCQSVTGTGSTFRPGGRVYRQAGTGAVWRFNNEHVDMPGSPSVELYYSSGVTYPNGEAVTIYYDRDYLPDYPGRPYYRPTLMTSNLGYYITIAYQPGELGTPGWNAVSEAAIYREAGATDILLGRLTYSGDTITQYGEGNQNPRTYLCTGCTNALAADVDTFAGSLTLPGESTPTVQAFQAPENDPLLAGSQVVGTVIRDGVTWTYSYEGLGQASPSNAARVFRAVTVTGPNGFNQRYDFDIVEGRNVLTRITDSLSRVTEITSDEAYRPVRVVHPEDNAVGVAYDPQGNLVSRRAEPEPLSNLADIVETAVYPEPPQGMPNTCTVLCWRPSSSRDALSRQTDYLYNASGQMTVRTDPADASGVRRTTTIDYQLPGATETRQTTMTVLSRRWRIVTCGTGAACGTGAQIRTEYDYWPGTFLPLAEHRIDAARGITLTTAYDYDDAGRVTMIDGPLPGTGDAAYNRYDPHGRRTWEIGPLGANGLRLVQRHFYRDSDDRRTRTQIGTVTDPNSTVLTTLSRTDYAYDARRNPVRETVASGTTTFTLLERRFDDRGQLECEARRMNPAAFGSPPPSACTLGPQGTGTLDFGPDRITRNLYDAAGQLLTVQRAYGVTTANGFPVTLQQNYASYEYDDNGRRTFVTDANGNRAQMTWDGHGRQRRWIFPAAATGAPNPNDYEEYDYDLAGNRISLRKRDGSTLTYAYDALNRMTRKTVPERAGLDPIHTRDVYYGYNVLNLQTYARFEGDSGAGVTNSYDGFGRLLTSTTDLFGSRSVTRVRDDVNNRVHLTYGGQTYRYDLDPAGRLTDLYEGTGTGIPLHRFVYNARGQVELRTEGVASSVDPGYDAIGRLTGLVHVFAGGVGNVTLGFTLNPASQIDARTRNNDDYAWNGGVDVTRTYTINRLNQYTAAGGTGFTYDANGNLLTSGTTNYVYDVENRLVSASGGHTAALRYDPLGRLYEVTGTSTPRRFLWDGDALVAEYTSTGSLGARFVHGTAAGVDDPLVWYGGGENRRLHADHQGSIIAITYGTGAIRWINGYDEWGIPNDPVNTGRFQYTGQLWIGELGLYHYKARIYSPTLGRFLQTDPVGYEDQINLYAYVGNDPMNLADPSGMATEEEIAQADRTLQRLRAQVQREIDRASVPDVGSRLRSNSDTARITALRGHLAALNELTGADIADMTVGAPSATVGAGMTNAMSGAVPETMFGATGSADSPAYGRLNQSSRTVDSGEATAPRNLLAIGHPHGSGSGREYPGIADPGSVLVHRVPMINLTDGNSNAIGWNGTRFTLSNIRGALPNYNSAPQWIRDTFSPW